MQDIPYLERQTRSKI